LTPGFLLRGFEFDRTGSDRGGMGGGDVGGDEGDFDAEGLGGSAGGDVALGEVGFAEAVVGEGEGGFAGFEFAVVAGFMEEALFETEGSFKELEGGGDVGDVDDRIGEFHGLEGEFLTLMLRRPVELRRMVIEKPLIRIFVIKDNRLSFNKRCHSRLDEKPICLRYPGHPRRQRPSFILQIVF
jgi:hypothetical protein